MYRILNRVSRFDNSVFSYPRMEWLTQRLTSNLQRVHDTRTSIPGRVESNHLLFKILNAINIPFTGDLVKYMADVDSYCKVICQGMGIVSSFSRGKLFTEGLFYPGCPEIIIYSRDDESDAVRLFKDWRNASPITVINHPVTDLTVVELGLKTDFWMEEEGLAIIKIDIPLLAAQFLMWKATYPDRNTEFFLSTIPLVNMIKSHLDVAFFNRVQMELGIKPRCEVRTNVPSAQNDPTPQINELVKDIVSRISGKRMTGNQILSNIPVPYGNSVLDVISVAPTAPTFQVLWALLAVKMELVATVLEFGKRAGYDQMLKELTVIRRSLIEIDNDKVFDNGLTTAGTLLMNQRVQDLVVSRLPE